MKYAITKNITSVFSIDGEFFYEEKDDVFTCEIYHNQSDAGIYWIDKSYNLARNVPFGDRVYYEEINSEQEKALLEEYDKKIALIRKLKELENSN